MTVENELSDMLAQVEAAALWHPVERVRNLLRRGRPEADDHLALSLQQLDFQGKSVADLGSNIGQYAFWAALLGAAEVQAFDFGPEVVRIGRLLAEAHAVPQVAFVLSDFGAAPSPRKFDVAMMLDIIGNNKVRKGRVRPLLDILAAWSDKELVTNVRPVYGVQEELGVSDEALLAHYPGEFIRQGRLYLLEWVLREYGAVWEIRQLGAQEAGMAADKPALHFLRRNP